MSVLVEAYTLVVPRAVLDARFREGTEGWLREMVGLGFQARYACADAFLACASFLGGMGFEDAVDYLHWAGVARPEEGRYREYAILDGRMGPIRSCDWLGWTLHDEGWMEAWLAAEERGELAAPEGWTPCASRLVRQDLRDEPGRCVLLAREDGVESWLDLETGKVMEDLPERPPRGSCEVNAEGSEWPEPGPLLALVIDWLEAQRRTYERTAEWGVLVPFREANGSYEMLLAATDTPAALTCLVPLVTDVPEYRRATLAEAVARVNHEVQVGHVELGMDDGVLWYRNVLNLDGIPPVPRIVTNLVLEALRTCERWGEPLDRVVSGEVEAETVLGAAEGEPTRDEDR